MQVSAEVVLGKFFSFQHDAFLLFYFSYVCEALLNVDWWRIFVSQNLIG